MNEALPFQELQSWLQWLKEVCLNHIQEQKPQLALPPELAPGPVAAVCNALNLNDQERFILLLAVAPAVDEEFAGLYGQIMESPHPLGASLALAAKLMGLSEIERNHLRHSLSGLAPLRFWQIIEPQELHLAQGRLTPDARIVDFLCQSPFLDNRLVSFFYYYNESQAQERLFQEEDKAKEYRHLAARLQGDNPPKWLHLFGPNLTDIPSLANFITLESGKPLFLVKAKNYLQAQAANLDLLILREVLLHQGILFVNLEELSEEEQNSIFPLLQSATEHLPLVLTGGDSSLEMQAQGRAQCKVELPGDLERARQWKEELQRLDLEADDKLLKELAGNFAFDHERIQFAAQETASLRLGQQDLQGPLLAEELWQGAHSQTKHRLHKLAKRIEVQADWADLVTQPKTLQQLHEILDHFRYRHQIWIEWGFAGKSGHGKGLNCLFYGPSGTGKTMAAGILAKKLRIELYQVDLSQVVSKYIGETEKNLERIFSEAERGQALLFFDEADALFGKRSSVSDSHDRYANIETGYLLQRMEEYQGITVLATNLRQNMDDAFLRRMRFMLEFPFPEAKQRSQLWKEIFPQAAPLDQNIDFDFLGKRLKLSGGHIKNAALSASFHAASEESPITFRHLLQAAMKECQKLGMPLLQSELGSYAHLAEEEPYAS